AHDHDVALVRIDYRPAADVIRGIRYHRKRERRRGLRMEILAHLAHAPFNLPFDLSAELSAAWCVEGRIRELLERAAGHPLRVDGQQLAARQAQRELDDLAGATHVAAEHGGRQ